MTRLRLVLLATTTLTALQFATAPSHAQTAPLFSPPPKAQGAPDAKPKPPPKPPPPAPLPPPPAATHSPVRRTAPPRQPRRRPTLRLRRPPPQVARLRCPHRRVPDRPRAMRRRMPLRWRRPLLPHPADRPRCRPEPLRWCATRRQRSPRQFRPRRRLPKPWRRLLQVRRPPGRAAWMSSVAHGGKPRKAAARSLTNPAVSSLSIPAVSPLFATTKWIASASARAISGPSRSTAKPAPS